MIEPGFGVVISICGASVSTDEPSPISHDIKMNNIDKNHKLLRKRFIKTFLKIKNLKKVSTFESF